MAVQNHKARRGLAIVAGVAAIAAAASLNVMRWSHPHSRKA
jgi:hypothetical protein